MPLIFKSSASILDDEPVNVVLLMLLVPVITTSFNICESSDSITSNLVLLMLSPRASINVMK